MQNSIFTVSKWTPAITSLEDLKQDKYDLVHPTTVERVASILHFNSRAQMLMGEFRVAAGGSSKNENDKTQEQNQDASTSQKKSSSSSFFLGVPSRVSSKSAEGGGYDQYGSVLLDISVKTLIREKYEVVAAEEGTLNKTTGKVILPLKISNNNKSNNNSNSSSTFRTNHDDDAAEILKSGNKEKKSFAASSSIWCTTFRVDDDENDSSSSSYHIQPQIILGEEPANNNSTNGNNNSSCSIFLRIEKIRFIRHLASFNYRNCQFGAKCYKSDQLRQELIRRFWNDAEFNGVSANNITTFSDDDEENSEMIIEAQMLKRKKALSMLSSLSDEFVCSDCAQMNKFLFKQGGAPSLILHFRNKYKDQWQRKIMLLMYAFSLQNLFALQKILKKVGVPYVHLEHDDENGKSRTPTYFVNEFKLPENAKRALESELPAVFSSSPQTSSSSSSSFASKIISQIIEHDLTNPEVLVGNASSSICNSSIDVGLDDVDEEDCCTCDNSREFIPTEDPFLTFSIFTSSSSAKFTDAHMRSEFLFKRFGTEFAEKFIDLSWKKPLPSASSSASTTSSAGNTPLLFSATTSSPFVVDVSGNVRNNRDQQENDNIKHNTASSSSTIIEALNQTSFSPSTNPASRVLVFLDDAHLGSARCFEVNDDDEDSTSLSKAMTSEMKIDHEKAVYFQKDLVGKLLLDGENHQQQQRKSQRNNNNSKNKKNLIIFRISSTPLPSRPTVDREDADDDEENFALNDDVLVNKIFPSKKASTNTVFYYNPPKTYIGWEVFRSPRIVVDLENADAIRFPRAPVKTSDRLLVERRYLERNHHSYNSHNNNNVTNETEDEELERQELLRRRGEIIALSCEFKPLTFSDSSFEKPDINSSSNNNSSNEMKNEIISVKLELANKMERLYEKHHPEEAEKRKKFIEREQQRLSGHRNFYSAGSMLLRRQSSSSTSLKTMALAARRASSLSSSSPVGTHQQGEETGNDNNNFVLLSSVSTFKSPEESITSFPSFSADREEEEDHHFKEDDHNTHYSTANNKYHHKTPTFIFTTNSPEEESSPTSLLLSPPISGASAATMGRRTSTTSVLRSRSYHQRTNVKRDSIINMKNYDQVIHAFSNSNPEAIQLRRSYQNTAQIARNNLLLKAQEKYFNKILKQYREALKIFLDDPDTRFRDNIVQLIKTLRYRVGEKVNEETGAVVMKMTPMTAVNTNNITSQILKQQVAQQEQQQQQQDEISMNLFSASSSPLKVNQHLDGEEDAAHNTEKKTNNHNNVDDVDESATALFFNNSIHNLSSPSSNNYLSYGSPQKNNTNQTSAKFFGFSSPPASQQQQQSSSSTMNAFSSSAATTSPRKVGGGTTSSGISLGDAARSIHEANTIRDSGKWERTGVIRFQSSIAPNQEYLLHQAATFVNAMNITYTNKMNSIEKKKKDEELLFAAENDKKMHHHHHNSPLDQQKQKQQQQQQQKDEEEEGNKNTKLNSNTSTSIRRFCACLLVHPHQVEPLKKKFSAHLFVTSDVRVALGLPSPLLTKKRKIFPFVAVVDRLGAESTNDENLPQLPADRVSFLDTRLCYTECDNYFEILATKYNKEMRSDLKKQLLREQEEIRERARQAYEERVERDRNQQQREEKSEENENNASSSPMLLSTLKNSELFLEQLAQLSEDKSYTNTEYAESIVSGASPFGSQTRISSNSKNKQQQRQHMISTLIKLYLEVSQVFGFEKGQLDSDEVDPLSSMMTSSSHQTTVTAPRPVLVCRKETLRFDPWAANDDFTDLMKFQQQQQKILLSSSSQQQQSKVMKSPSSSPLGGLSTSYAKKQQQEQLRDAELRRAPSPTISSHRHQQKNKNTSDKKNSNKITLASFDYDADEKKQQREQQQQSTIAAEKRRKQQQEQQESLLFSTPEKILNDYPTYLKNRKSFLADVIHENDFFLSPSSETNSYKIVTICAPPQCNKNEVIYDVIQKFMTGGEKSSSQKNNINNPLPLARPTANIQLQNEMKMVFDEFNLCMKSKISSQLGRMNFGVVDDKDSFLSTEKAAQIFSPPRLLVSTNKNSRKLFSENDNNFHDKNHHRHALLEEKVAEIESQTWQALPPLEKFLLDKLQFSDFSSSQQELTNSMLQMIVAVVTSSSGAGGGGTVNHHHQKMKFSFLIKNLQEQGFFQASSNLRQNFMSESCFTIDDDDKKQNKMMNKYGVSTSSLENSVIFRFLATLREYFVAKQQHQKHRAKSNNSEKSTSINSHLFFSSSTAVINIFPSLAILACVLLNDLISFLEQQQERTTHENQHQHQQHHRLVLRNKVMRFACLGIINKWRVEYISRTSENDDDEDEDEFFHDRSVVTGDDLEKHHSSSTTNLILFRTIINDDDQTKKASERRWANVSKEDVVNDLWDLIHSDDENENEEQYGGGGGLSSAFGKLLLSMFHSRIVHLMISSNDDDDDDDEED